MTFKCPFIYFCFTTLHQAASTRASAHVLTMGVRKLKSFLEDNKGSVSELISVKDSRNSAPQPPRVVLVDGNGFLMDLQEQALARASEAAFLYADADIVGGDLQPFRSALMYVVNRLRSLHNVKLVFAYDAPQGLIANDSREATWKERADERLAREKELELYCKGDALERNKRRERPSMITGQALATLACLGVQILELDDEVDAHIGALVQTFKPICVITNDTDLVVTSAEVPATLMQIDFPWDALFHGWDPRRHNGSSAKANSPKPLTFRVFKTAKLLDHLSNYLHNSPGYFTIRHLWTAASLSGNDATHASVVKRSPTGVMYTEDILSASRRVKLAEQRGPSAFGLNDAGVQLIQESVQRYELSASTKQHFRLTGEPRDVYRAMVMTQRLPTSYFLARRDCEMTDEPTIPRLRELLCFVAHVLGCKVVSFSSHDAPDVVEDVPIVLRREVERCIRKRWSVDAPTDPRPHDVKIEALALMFAMDPAVLLAAPSPQSLLPASVWLLLWVLRPACSAAAYRHVVEMMVLVRLSEAQGADSLPRKIIEGLAHWGGSRAQRPSLAAVQLVGQFAAARREVQNLMTLLSLGDALGLPEPADVFSGSLLHYLFCFGDRLDIGRVVDSLAAPLDDEELAGVATIMSAIDEFSEERFAAVFDPSQ
jgi:hypothetical protein